jgi:hypothetical protein
MEGRCRGATSLCKIRKTELYEIGLNRFIEGGPTNFAKNNVMRGTVKAVIIKEGSTV